jgi:hypothetical protein
MQGYSRIRGSRSVDLEERNWKDFRAEVKPSVKGSAKWAFNSNDSRGRDPDFVKEEKEQTPLLRSVLCIHNNTGGERLSSTNKENRDVNFFYRRWVELWSYPCLKNRIDFYF